MQKLGESKVKIHFLSKWSHTEDLPIVFAIEHALVSLFYHEHIIQSHCSVFFMMVKNHTVMDREDSVH